MKNIIMALFLGLLVTACSKENGSEPSASAEVKVDTGDAGDSLKRGLDKAGEELKAGAEKTKEALQDAGKTIKDKAEDVKDKFDDDKKAEVKVEVKKD